MGQAGAAEPVEDRVGYALKRAQHALRTRMDDALRDLGLTTAQYAALSALDEAPGLSGAELARRSFVTPQTMNGVVANLEAARLLVRRPHPDHGRVLRGYLTEAGRETLDRAHGLVRGIEARMVASLDEPEREHLFDALRRCAVALEADVGGTLARRDGG